MHSFIVGFISALPVMAVIGPIAVMLLDTGIRHRQLSLVGAAGVAAADLCFATLAWVGGAGLADGLSAHRQLLTTLASLCMVGIAAKMFVGARSEHRELALASTGPSLPATAVPAAAPTTAPDLAAAPALTTAAAVRRGDDATSLLAMFGRFFSLTIVNPVSIVAMAALVLGAGRSSGSPAWVVGVATASFLAHGAYCVAGSVLGGALPPTVRPWLRGGGAGAVLLMATFWMFG